MYFEHHRFLRKHHHYRKLKKAFNGCVEHRPRPKILTGSEVYNKVKNIDYSIWEERL